jgi:Methyltransferase domain
MGTRLAGCGIKAKTIPWEPNRSAPGGKKMLDHLLNVCGQRLRGIPRTPAEVNYSLQMLSVMRELGWHKSVGVGKPVEARGTAIPWYSYPALEWLGPRVKPSDAVFEYGAGNSTVWFGCRTERVVSVEHDSRWLAQVRGMVGENVTLLSRSALPDTVTGHDESPYVASLEEFAPGSFDIIVIDGVERVACAGVAIPRLRQDGIVIFDDSDRPAFRPGIERLHEYGFGRIDFYGFTGQTGTRKCTSIFSRFGTRWTAENVPLVSQGW